MTTDRVELSTERLNEVESFLFEWADEFDVPGVTTTMVTPEGEAMARGIGSRNLLENDPVTPDTLFGVGSVSKSFTASAVMQLVESGQLDLDESPAAYTEAAFDGVEDITLHEVLSHTSGLPSLGVSESLIAQQTDHADPRVPIGDWADFYQYLNGAGDEVIDEDRFLYSNSGYMLLAEVVSAVHDKPFHEILQAEVLDPLGMDRSTMRKSVFETDDDTMTPYRRDDETDTWTPTPMPVRDLSRGAGGLFTSARELGAYLRMYLNDGTAADGTQVLTPASIDQMTAAHAETSAGPYGYAWRTVDINDHTLIGHGGSIGVATAYVGWSRDLELGVALTCNAAPGHGLRMLGMALALIAAGGNPYEVHPFFRQKRRRQELVGTYESYRGARTARVKEHAGFLQLSLEEPLPLSPSSLVFDGETEDGYRYWTPTDDGRQELEFWVDGADITLQFDRWLLYQRGSGE